MTYNVFGWTLNLALLYSIIMAKTGENWRIPEKTGGTARLSTTSASFYLVHIIKNGASLDLHIATLTLILSLILTLRLTLTLQPYPNLYSTNPISTDLTF